MREPTIRDLLKLYEEGKATEEQRRKVEDYLAWHQEQSPRGWREPVDETDPLEEIMSKIRLAREQAGGEVIQEQAGEETPVYELTDRNRRRRYAWMAAASVAVIAVVTLLQSRNTRQPVPVQVAAVYKTVQAKPGETVHLLLSDSSEVWLNAGARIRYPQPFGDTMRKLELLDGEAFFQIHKETGRGFEVITDRVLTRVLGTSFNIKAYRESQHLSLTVITGKVGVQRRANGAGGQPAVSEILLTANQQVQYNEGTGGFTRGIVAAGRAPDWKKGIFNFTEESLGDITIELEHYFNVKINFKYSGLKKYLVSASFRHNIPVKDILTTLCLLNQNHLIQTDAETYVIH